MNGMDDNEDETDLFDDDFDNLSESALQELEQHALFSTQQASLQARMSTHAQQKHTSFSPNRLQAQAPLNTNPPLRHPAIQRHLTEPQSEDESFELVGEDGVSTPVNEHEAYPLRRPVVQRGQFRHPRNGHTYDGAPFMPTNPKTAQRQFDRSQPNASERGYHGVPSRSEEMLLDGPSQEGGGELQQTYGSDVNRSHLEELTKHRDELFRQLEATKDTVMMQKGEISIIRANFEKEIKVFDRQISALQKTMAEESAKHTAALQAMMEKNNTLTTRYNFLQQEYNQELQNSKALQQRLKERQQPAKDNNPTTTPKRGMVSSLRDGFDDDDVMAISPSKSGRRSKPQTPPAANKRKRKADVPSPVKPLVLRPPSTIPPESPPPPQPQPVQVEDQSITIVRTDKQAERNLRFLQDLLEYRVKGQTLIEALVGFSSPSNPSKTFSVILLERTARLKGPDLPRDVLHILIDLWSKSLKEEYYKPVALLTQIIKHVIELDLSVLDADTVAPLALVLQNSAYINARTRFKHSPVNPSTFGEVRQTPQSLLNHDVNGTACMELLLTIAYAISDEPDLLSLLWREMPPDFILMMLTVWQPVADITIMLQLLATSTFPSTFGSICVDDSQEYMEHHLLTRISSLLWEIPKVDDGLPPNTSEDICQLRVEVMNLLINIAIGSSPHPHDDQAHHGSQLIASHPSAIGRIVRSLYDEVSAMYELTPCHALHAEIVNKGVHLLYHVLQLQGAKINLQEKLSVVNGGVHKHRVVLTRLAFSEGFYIDKLIHDETVAMATSMLEESVTPDEADELIEAFPGFKGRSGGMVTE
ncbi:hypothetical protein A1O3_10219 [Capronia epimyces CBS 606.96]|uniref:DNA repair protein Rad26 n=1 Tax=Capronia epimyces CBS 606.96 TaxID=1182542 RepID=W9XJB0_9EURO|nr:uncharacterized protein A1O3_10219 [Capronia epimyces CBS 606.96]EXJ77061.1 hypothetical protein A1O3_10219 [Capronia epimyces CBS 606.96]